jgi:phosphatidylethanolamine-binding protein (PEBP) family uncharacterized protein
MDYGWISEVFFFFEEESEDEDEHLSLVEENAISYQNPPVQDYEHIYVREDIGSKGLVRQQNEAKKGEKSAAANSKKRKKVDLYIIAPVICVAALFIVFLSLRAFFRVAIKPHISGGDDDLDEAFTLISSAFVDGGELPDRYTCKFMDTNGTQGISPPLLWYNTPGKTREFFITMEKASGYSWSLYNVSRSITSIDANTSVGTLGATIDWDTDHDNYVPKYIYDEPCAVGAGLRYYTFTVWAFSHQVISIMEKMEITKEDTNPLVILDIMSKHILGNASITAYVITDSDSPTPSPTFSHSHR